MSKFIQRSEIPASAQAVFDWHEAPGAFQRLTPPWERVRVLRHEGGIRDGARVSLLVGSMPFALRWDLTHIDYRAGESFTDTQVKGPFKKWTHVHRMKPNGANCSILEDEIEYVLPGGWVGHIIGGPIMKRKLKKLFAFRHQVTQQAFAPHGRNDEPVG